MKNEDLNYLNLQMKLDMDDFIEIMSPIFSLDEVYNIPVVLTKNLNSLGSYFPGTEKNKRRIKINTKYSQEKYDCCDDCWNNYSMSRTAILSHEMTHYFHSLISPDQFKKGSGAGKTGEPDWYFNEMIAEIGLLRFLDKKYNSIKGFQTLFGFKWDSDETFANQNSVETAAYKYFLKNYFSIDEKLKNLSRFDSNELGEEFFPYAHYLRNAYTVPESILFGMCVKNTKTDAEIGQLQLF